VASSAARTGTSILAAENGALTRATLGRCLRGVPAEADAHGIALRSVFEPPGMDANDVAATLGLLLRAVLGYWARWSRLRYWRCRCSSSLAGVRRVRGDLDPIRQLTHGGGSEPVELVDYTMPEDPAQYGSHVLDDITEPLGSWVKRCAMTQTVWAGGAR
jgi:hypothetical protein